MKFGDLFDKGCKATTATHPGELGRYKAKSTSLKSLEISELKFQTLLALVEDTLRFREKNERDHQSVRMQCFSAKCLGAAD